MNSSVAPTKVIPLGHAVPEAAKLAVIPNITPSDPKMIGKETARLAALEKTKKNLLAVEDDGEISKLIEATKQTVQEINENDQRSQRMQKLASKGYQLMPDYEPFTWRNKDGHPRLAAFTLTSNTSEIPQKKPDSFTTTEDTWENFPQSIQNHYKDIRTALYGTKWNFIDSRKFYKFVMISYMILSVMMAWKYFRPLSQPTQDDVVCYILAALCCGLIGGAILGAMSNELIISGFGRRRMKSINAKFPGLIPDETKRKIKEAQDCELFDEVFLLAEVPHWNIQLGQTYSEMARKDREAAWLKFIAEYSDPLVIGHTKDDDMLWLIDTFDTTTLEQLIANNYAVNNP